ncbi:hypothetical protein Kpho02_38380 [Kitasatospora phosalacinea]|uniref:Uncharacterized protein n=1 Tax=Kitasatospora phosalacinea TaxID=2065 RepID=A0A9W6V132_9ACTN|nr:hypothetical protein [Kitasatospora phosalacinea]GLW71539.1 hypothetical protein Kpho02_38380 [Kitasatospora phosalacinea]
MEKLLWGPIGGVVAVLLLWGVLALHDGPARPVGFVGFLLVVALGVTGVIRLVKDDEAPAALAVMLLYSAWIALFIAVLGVQEQQILHDRGTTSNATVVRAIVTSDPMGGVGPSVTAVDVELDDGSVLHGISTKGDHPALGDRLQVTRDPRGTVGTRLGPRPDAPDRTVPVVLLSFMGLCALCALLAPGD